MRTDTSDYYKPDPDNGATEVTEEMFENERKIPLKGFSKKNLLFTERGWGTLSFSFRSVHPSCAFSPSKFLFFNPSFFNIYITQSASDPSPPVTNLFLGNTQTKTADRIWWMTPCPKGGDGTLLLGLLMRIMEVRVMGTILLLCMTLFFIVLF